MQGLVRASVPVRAVGFETLLGRRELQFVESPLKGLFIIETAENYDDRGSFFRSFCADEFQAHGLPYQFVQCGISRNTRCGTLRGMHFQREPRPEGKLVRCIKGKIHDVVVDLRGNSPTFRQWFAVDLDEAKATAVFIPAGMAHGFLTLADDTQVLYQMTEYYAPELAGGVRWNDPAFAISWPAEVKIISDRDSAFSDFQ